MPVKPPMVDALWQVRGAQPYYPNANKPIAVVLHIAVGWRRTAEAWAASGYANASWHYFVCLDGTILRQLDHQHGGYHAGIAPIRANGAANPAPTWKLWRGWNSNVNHYTIGIEHEGFGPITGLQAEASRALCKWLAADLGFPYSRVHFPAHAEIALIDRPNDFGPPIDREAHYRFMFEEDTDMPSPAYTGLQLRATGDFATMELTYASLDAKGFFKTLNDAEGPVAALDGDNDLNDSLVRRFRLQWLSNSDVADAAWAALQ